MTVRELRRRWKPLKDGDASSDACNPVRVRLHRCWSWMQRIEELDEAGVGIDDARLIYGWIALNSLYGRWDAQAREPIPDKLALDAFLRRLFDRDESALLRALITEQRDLVKLIVGDEYLSRYYWKDPGENEARRAQNAVRKLASWYVEGRHASVLDRTLQRIYLARCQLVHGAATYNSGLNRTAVQRCAEFLGMFLRSALVIIIDHAWRDDWDDLCYPPIDAQQGG
jgi:hypothetical protein